MNKVKRIYGIDLLRFVAMFGVVTLHTLGRSGILQSSNLLQYRIAWGLEILFYCSVNCFGMITGFVSYREEYQFPKMRRFFEIWLTVVFYGLIMVFLFDRFTSIEITRNHYITALFPLLKGEYWYFSAFAGVFFLGGIVNQAIKSLDNSKLFKISGIMVLLFGFIESISIRLNDSYTVFHMENGYSFAWLLLMYWFGAVIKKTNLSEYIQRKKLIVGIFGLLIITYVWMIWIGPKLVNPIGFGKNWGRFLVEYTSPTIILIASLTVILFSKIDINKDWIQKIISFITPSAFSIYILNSHPTFANHITSKTNLSFILKYNGFSLIGLVLCLSLLFVLCVFFVDVGRRLLFRILCISQKK